MKKIITIFALIFTILLSYFNILYAIGTITEKHLETSFKHLKETQSSNNSNTNLEIDKKNNKIILTSNNLSHSINYNLSNKPTFLANITLDSKMSEKELETEVGKESTLYIMFGLVANYFNISFDDSMLYIMTTYFQNSFKNQVSSNESNALKSQISRYKAMEGTYTDTFFTFNTKKISENNDNYKVQITLVVNTDADFSKLKGYSTNKMDEISKDFSTSILNAAQNALDKYKESQNKTENKNQNIDLNKIIKEVIIIPPTKTKYKVGEKLDLTGLKIVAVYGENSIESITKDYTVNGYNRYKSGKQTVTISYKGFSRSYNVAVGNVSINIDHLNKLPQTGRAFTLTDGLYLLCAIFSILLIFIVYKSVKTNKVKK